MDTQQKLNLASPIVQRVLCLRENLPHDEKRYTFVDTAKKSYRWQTWQKSDLSAYADDEPEHRCK